MLVYRDFAVQESDRRYAAGPVLRIGALSSPHAYVTLRTLALPHLRSLVNRVDESANLTVLSGAHTRFLASVECSHPLRVSDRAGAVLPANLTSGGQAILASLPKADVDRRFASDARGDLGVDLIALHRELAAVRRVGFALNRDRTEVGVTAIGRLLRDANGTACGAVSLSLPSSRFEEANLPRYVSELAVCAHDIERDLAVE